MRSPLPGPDHRFEDLDGGQSAAILSDHVGPDEGDSTKDAALDLSEDARYRPREFLGRGGMGHVVSVHDQRLDRDIALKAANPEAPLDAGLDALLAREARITARLDHPGIVPIYDAGHGPDGRVYYTMPIVRGRSLAEVLTATQDPDARLRLLRRVLEASEAVGHAHRQGIVHCDLKPANVMLGEGGGTRVLDWGLARTIDEPPRGVVGTAQYMSPEQARGAPPDMRSDVYSLGAILFEVCTGRPLRKVGSASRILATARRPTLNRLSAHVFEDELAPELVAIVKRAIAPSPDDRYPDAQALADDLARFLDGRRVTAHAYSRREILARLMKRWRVPLMVAGVALVVVVVLVVIGMVRLADEASRAAAAERRTRVAFEAASAELARALVSQAILESDKGARAEAEILAAHALARKESPLARGVLLAGSAMAAPELVSRVAVPPCVGIIVLDEVTFLCREEQSVSRWRVANGRAGLAWRSPQAIWQAVRLGDRIVARSGFRELTWFDEATGVVRARSETSCVDDLFAAAGKAFTRDSGCFEEVRSPSLGTAPVYPCVGHDSLASLAVGQKQWVAACGDGILVVGDLDRPDVTRRFVATALRGGRVPLALGFADPRHVVAGTADGQVALIDLDTGATRTAVDTGFAKVMKMDVADSGRLVAVTAATGDVVLIEPFAGLVRGRLPHLRVRRAIFSGDSLVVASSDLRRYRFGPGPPASWDLGAGVTSIHFDRWGARVAVTTGSGLEVRALADGAVVGLQKAASGAFMKGGAFTQDGDRFLTNSVTESYLRAFDARTWEPLPDLALSTHVRRIVALADGGLAVAKYLGGLQLIDPDGAESSLLPRAEQRMGDLDTSPGGRFAVFVRERDRMVMRLVVASRHVEELERDANASAVAVGVDGVLVAIAGSGGVTLWDAERGVVTDYLDAGTTRLLEVAISPEMRWVAAGGEDGSVRLWEVASRRLVAQLAAHTERISSLAFSGDSRFLASGAWDNRVRLYALGSVDRPGVELVRELESSWGITRAEILAP